MRRAGIVWILLLLLCGCSVQTNKREKLRDLEYRILEEREIPADLRAILEEKREKEFKLTYEEEKKLYLCIGYGEQETGGYSIAVKELYLSENAVYFDTNLMGPGKEEAASQAKSYPYLVVQTEDVGKPVVFQ